MEETLFIGGYWDGKLTMIDGSLMRYRVAAPIPGKDAVNPYPEPMCKSDDYRLEYFVCDDERFRLMVLVSIPMKRAVKMLIAGYRKSA